MSFKIIVLRIHVPEAFLVRAGADDAVCRQKPRQHGMIHVVVAVLAVAAHAEKVVETVQEPSDLRQLLIGIKVSRIRLWHQFAVVVQHVRARDEPQTLKLRRRGFRAASLVQTPEIVVFAAKIFKAQLDRVIRRGRQSA